MFRVQGSGFRVQGSGFRVRGSRCKLEGRDRAAVQRDEGRARLLEYGSVPYILPFEPSLDASSVWSVVISSIKMLSLQGHARYQCGHLIPASVHHAYNSSEGHRILWRNYEGKVLVPYGKSCS